MRPGALSPGHSRGSSHRRLFCFFFLRLKKEDISYSRGRKSLQIPSPSAVAATSPEGRGFKIRLTCKQKKLISPLYLNRKTNLVLIFTLTQKFFAFFFLKKYGAFLQKQGRSSQCISRKTNLVLIFTLTQKFFAYFFNKKVG